MGPAGTVHERIRGGQKIVPTLRRAARDRGRRHARTTGAPGFVAHHARVPAKLPPGGGDRLDYVRRAVGRARTAAYVGRETGLRQRPTPAAKPQPDHFGSRVPTAVAVPQRPRAIRLDGHRSDQLEGRRTQCIQQVLVRVDRACGAPRASQHAGLGHAQVDEPTHVGRPQPEGAGRRDVAAQFEEGRDDLVLAALDRLPVALFPEGHRLHIVARGRREGHCREGHAPVSPIRVRATLRAVPRGSERYSRPHCSGLKVGARRVKAA